MVSIAVIVKLIANETETKGDVSSLVNELVHHTRKEKNCLYYSFLQIVDSSNDYMFIEKYTDAEAVEYHNSTHHFTTIVPNIAKLCTFEHIRKAAFIDEGSKGSSIANSKCYDSISNAVRLIVTVKVTNIDEFLKNATTLIVASNEEYDCLEYGIAKYLDAEDEYAFIELWKSEEGLKTHSNSPHCKALLPLLDTVSTVTKVYKMVQA